MGVGKLMWSTADDVLLEQQVCILHFVDKVLCK